MICFQTDNLCVDKPSAEAAVLLLDVAGRSVNVFNRQVLADFARALEQLAGDTALRFLIGQMMKITKGKANPKLAEELLRAKLESLKK